MKRLFVTLAVLCIGALFGPGCAHVEPWQRGHLASYEMRADRDPIASKAYEHTYFSREGASGGRGVGGGGCGCN